MRRVVLIAGLWSAVFIRINKVSDRLNHGVDVVEDVLETLRFRGSTFFQSQLAAPWGMSLEPVGTPRIHIVFSGSCFVGSDSIEPVQVGAMEIVVLPKGDLHWIADRPGRALIPSERAGNACELGSPMFQNGEITNRLMCGILRFDTESPHPMLDSLPRILHLPNLDPGGPIWMTVALIDVEIRRAQSNRTSIVDRLTEVLFLQILHHHIGADDQPTGFLAALRDRRIHRALTLIHQDTAFDWTLKTLGERVGMSRATLTRRFQEVVGVAPMAYVTGWRVTKAYNAVKTTAAPLEQIAESTGFASARTLTRAFERQYGITPNEARRGRGKVGTS